MSNMVYVGVVDKMLKIRSTKGLIFALSLGLQGADLHGVGTFPHEASNSCS